MDALFKIASNISTPLALGGLFAAIFFFLAKQIIERNIFPLLTKKISSEIIKLIIHYVFILSIISMFLGFIGFLILITLNNPNEPLEILGNVRIIENGSPVSPAHNATISISKLPGYKTETDKEGNFSFHIIDRILKDQIEFQVTYKGKNFYKKFKKSEIHNIVIEIPKSDKIGTFSIDKKKEASAIVTLRSDFNNATNLPYGWLYWGGQKNIRKVIALPYSVKQMHTVLRFPIANQHGTEYDIPKDTDVSHMTKVAYSSIVFNNSTVPVIVENVRLILDSHQSLPHRSVAIWHPKGLVPKSVVRLYLTPKKAEQFLFDGKDSVYELMPGESFPFRIDILGGEPGLYKLHVAATALVNDQTVTIRSPSTEVAVLRPESVGNMIQIRAIGPSLDLAAELLALSPKSFQKLAKRFIRKYPRDSTVRQLLDKDYIDKNNSQGNWKRYRQREDAMHSALRGDLGYIQYLGHSFDIDDANQHIQDYLTQHPDSEAAKEILISFLMAQGKKSEARQIAQKFIAKQPESFRAHLSFWKTDPSVVEHLERAIALAPNERQPYLAAAFSHIAGNQTLPNNFFINIKHLSREDRQQLLLDTMKGMYLLNFGLDYDQDDIAFLNRVDTHAKMLFNVLPEDRLYRPLLKNVFGEAANQISIDDKSMPLLVDLLISVGRLRLAVYYARQTGRKSMVKAFGAACDFDNLVDIARTILNQGKDQGAAVHFLDGSTMYDKITPFEYIVCGLAILERKEWDLFDKFVDNHVSTLPNQTNLLRGVYNQLKGNFEVAKVQVFYYWMHTANTIYSMHKPKDPFDPIEKEFVNDIENAEIIFTSLLNSKKNNNRNLTSEIHKIIFNSDGKKYTYWPQDYGHKNHVSGYDFAFSVHRMGKYLELPPDKNYLVRIPNMVMPFMVFMGRNKAFDVGPFAGLQLSEVSAANERNRALFRSGVYGKRLSENQTQNSYLLHLAWYYYWNEGKLDHALAYLNKAIENEPDFYDALLLRARVFFAKGNLTESCHNIISAQRIGPLLDIDTKIAKRCSQAELKNTEN